jgi:lipoprotein-anchoring transpeptidase ErfK/SrfK
MGTWKMDARLAARVLTGLSLPVLSLSVLSLPILGVSFLAVAGIGGEALAQNYPSGPYAPPPPGAYRGAPAPYDDDDVAPLPAPGPYGRPSGAPYPYDVRPPSTIQREALPAPGGMAPAPYGGYADGPPPGARGGYTYGPWEPVRPPGDMYGPGPLPPGPAARPYDYGARPPLETTPSQGYAALPPDYQPEAGQPKELPPQFRRQMVDYPSREPAGTLIIDTPNTYLYLVLGGGKAMRYGIGVGREGFTWAGREKISRMSEWPDWHPPKEMIDRQPYLPRFMAGGESNPLGARALYLGNTLYRIHGTNQPSTIGSFVSSGCIRLTNGDIEDLYGRVTVGTKVVVLPGGKTPETTASFIR